MPVATLRRAVAPTLVLALVACGTIGRGGSSAATADSSAILRDVAWLADDAREGRGTGTAGNDSAARYIARRFEALGLQAPAGGYLQRFTARSVADQHAGAGAGRATQNVVGILPGRDATLRNEYVIVGAHFDHLGRSSASALDPDARDAIRNGADDNASGTAAILEIARLMAKNPPKRSIVFVAFSGEELGLLGSRHFVENSPVPLTAGIAMLNFDMVGRLRDDKLIVYGTATAREMPALLDSANATLATPLRISGVGDGYGPSDHSSFYEKDLPVLHFFTDLHDDYHRATDDVVRINAGGIARVVTLANDVTRRLADRDGKLSFVRVAAPVRTRSSAEGSQAYLGTVPDMSAGDVVGMRITGVRPGSPAEQAGMRGGDIIVELGGRSVKDIYEYTNALYAHQPGSVVKIVVLRGEQRMEFSVTLGRRGQ